MSMLTRAGWAEFTEDYDLDEEDSAAFTCERLLADLADEAVGELSAARNQTFGDIDVSHLDAQFVREDGSLDIVAAQESIRRTWEDNTGPVALWSARRLLSGRVRDDERIGLHLCLWMGVAQSYAGLPPSYTRDIAAALATVDLDVACAHPRHPGPPYRPRRRPGTARWSTCTHRTTTRTPRAGRALRPRPVGVPRAVRRVDAKGAGRPAEMAHRARRRRGGLSRAPRPAAHPAGAAFGAGSDGPAVRRTGPVPGRPPPRR
ncbi:hypothetical protein ACFQ60_29680 [Streptomyces zhihengii]